MSYKSVKLTKRKHKLYKKYGDAKHPDYVMIEELFGRFADLKEILRRN